jgi:hypothetical protein
MTPVGSIYTSAVAIISSDSDGLQGPRRGQHGSTCTCAGTVTGRGLDGGGGGGGGAMTNGQFDGILELPVVVDCLAFLTARVLPLSDPLSDFFH